jgi:hypothetical protein
MTVEDLVNVNSHRVTRVRRLARALGNQETRHSYMARQLKAFLAQQIRALRGDQSQKDFGERIHKPQSVVSRLEKQADRHISIQTLIDIAERLDIAVIIRFVDFVTFLRYTDDYSESAIKPDPFRQEAIDEVARDAEQSISGAALNSLLSSTQTAWPSAGSALGQQAVSAIAPMPQPPANDTGLLSAFSPLPQSKINGGAPA